MRGGLEKQILRAMAAAGIFGFGALFDFGLPWMGLSAFIFSAVCFLLSTL